MAGFDEVETFAPLLAKIQNGEIKTVHQLRLLLEATGDKFDVTPLNMLLLFREWLGGQGLDISTANGEVTLFEVE